ncbi:CNDH2 protein, partial [Pycnonotus jocosus]|nr:CNDH2 protein [Pycnonotus jocosus]
RKERLPTSLGPDGRDADATFTDREEEFLSLDDIPDTSQASVDMRRDQQPAAVNIVPLTPMSLVPPEEGEKKENPLLSRRGEVLASRRDFRINTSTPHASGAFLLELAGLSPVHLQQEQHLGTPTGTRGALGCRWHCHCHHQGLTCRCPPAAAPGSAGCGAAPVQALSFSEEAGPDDDDVPGALGDDMEVTLVPNEGIQAQRSTPQTRGYVLRERPPSQDPKPHSKEEPNPWQSLDPFGDSEEKPFRKGRPFMVPPGLEDTVGGKRKRRGPRKLQDFMRWFSAVYNNTTEGRKSRRKGPTFADLEVLYWRHFKERMAAHRKLHTRGSAGGVPIPVPVSPGGSGVSPEGSGCPQSAGDVPIPVPVSPECQGCPHSHPCVPRVPGMSPFPSLCPQELFMASSQKFAQETELSQRIRLWEERVEPLLQEQARTPGGTGTTGESRAPFSVRSYGLALTQRCAERERGRAEPGRAEPGQWHSLASLVAGQPPFEVCRYLLASLQLANDEEVELAQEAGLEEGLDAGRPR